MTIKQMFRGSLTLLAGVALCAVSSSFLAAQQSRLRVLQTNFAGDSVNIIDPASRPAVINKAFLQAHPSFVPDWNLEGGLGTAG